jgi:hypothetical protein
VTGNDYVGDVVGDLEADGWDVSQSRVKEDAVVLTGDQTADSTARLAALVVDADTEVTPKYVKYLAKTASDRNADTAFVSTLGTLTPDARDLAEDYGITVVDPEVVGASAVTDATESAAESTESEEEPASSSGEPSAGDATLESETATATDESATEPEATEPEGAVAAGEAVDGADEEQFADDSGATDEQFADDSGAGDEQFADDSGAGDEQFADDSGAGDEQFADDTGAGDEQFAEDTSAAAEPSRDAEFWATDDGEDSTEGVVSAAAASSSASVTASDEPPEVDQTPAADDPNGGHQPRATADSWRESPPPGDDDSLLARLTSGKELVVVAVALLAVGLLVTGGGAGIPGIGGDEPTTVDGTDPVHTGDTGDEATSQVSNRTAVVQAIGEVQNGSVDTVKLTVRQSAGSGDIDLSKSTVQWVGPNDAATLTWAETTDSTSFTTRAIKGDSATILDSQEDRIELVVDANAVAGGLDAGEEVELTITTQHGATTTYVLTVPDSLDGKDLVEL